MQGDRRAPLSSNNSTDPPDGLRARTGRDVLDILTGRQLQNQSRDSALRAALHAVQLLPTELGFWEALSANASRHGIAAVAGALTSATYKVPDIEGASECRCQLTTQPVARRFQHDSRLNRFASTLFESIAVGASDKGLPAVALDRFDLFHAHIFLTHAAVGRPRELGLLFHAKEYPQQGPAFPVNLGFCQRNSTLAFDQRGMDLRNLLFFRGQLCALDVGEASVLHADLLMDGLQDVRTVLETDLGQAIAMSTTSTR
ncbi:hypothetical protein WJX81_002287 [Elliptochloris bilobata]|uniref:Uncharacterized protein n=1 Tax=Elliptochloris bilobata TaxID=381761 RepID=A0AAW1QZE0_9CHLO